MDEKTGKVNIDSLFVKASQYWDEGRLELAFENFLYVAELGDVSSQGNVAIFYEGGLGVKRDFNKAIFWYKKAHENGSPVALHNLADMYKKNGDYKKAIYWYKESIKTGDDDSLLEMGKMYYYGRGVEKNMRSAKEYFNKTIHSEKITPILIDRAKEYLEEMKES
ncbi:MAG: sel1 repeat family protein [Methylococcales bacterium]|jgi:TPR repeat protein|nr:sel1 repeat family protein [Methylococcales bacterium]MBT7410140.1 sel1 repeat family protein [Methylococcales bacterium]